MKLMLLDDHRLFAMSLEFCLKNVTTDFTAFTTSDSLLAALVNGLPDILLLDVSLKHGQSGLTVAKQVLELYPEIKIIFLSGYDLTEYHRQSINIGARGFLSKDISLEDLEASLRRVLAGEIIFPDEIDFGTYLTETEKKVLQLLSEGKTQDEVSNLLFASSRTIANHTASIRRKLQATNLAAAVRKGIEIGIVKILR